jgi:outer membrane receptor protein involved in Fe transport
VGPSGISRSLVLVDGVPANDPFGGWVYWRAIPRLGIQQLEVVPGGGSALYGNYALSGVTQVISRPIVQQTLTASGEYGSFGSGLFGLRAAERWGPFGAAVEGELLNSGGYPVVADYNRGPVDRAAPSEHGTVNARAEGQLSPDFTLALRGGYFYEDQNGGTQFTTAAVRRFEYAATARATPGTVGAIDLAVFGHAGTFRQRRARFTPNRAAEFLSANQDVPMHDLGASLVWTSLPLPLLGTHALTVGSDARRITAETREDLFPSPATGTSVRSRDARGEQRLYGFFAQEVYDASEAVQLSLAVRYDRWNNLNASRVEELFNGSSSLTRFSGRSDGELSPKAGLRVRPIDWLTVRASGYRAFRAPTLNELYRPFQVGTIRTDSNENLGPETLVGAEAGVEVAAPFGIRGRLTAFRNELMNPITNVTVGPNLRQRQNLGQARIQGIETDAGWRIARNWLVTAAYTFVSTRISEAPGQPQLIGKQLPQDPKHRTTFSVAFDDPRRFTAQALVHHVSAQFEDDLNTLSMSPVVLVDLFFSWHATPYVDLFAAVDNLFDRVYLVGRSGVDTVGQPRFIHGGIRLQIGR